MGHLSARRRHTAASLLFAGCMLAAAGPWAIAADVQSGDVVTVRAQTVAGTLSAYGQIEPIAVAQVRAVDPGTLTGLHVVPGSLVAAGEALARISGPRMQSLLTTREQTLRSARAREDAADRALTIVKRQFVAQLATRQAVDAAQSDLAAAHAAVQTADAQLREARDQQTVRAPAAGTVIAVQAANGEQISAGQTLLTLQPAGHLWIRATYYGANTVLLRAGMTGRFRPSGAGKAIPVKVAAIASGLAADAGLRVGLVPTASDLPAWWASGQWGTVALEGPPRQMVAVPTTALILDRGAWWVLLHTPKGNTPRQVVPGPTQGWQTWIVSGLVPGQQVVVQDAFLEYHRGIARSYQPPD
ncbi:MAG: efflux RND transporter periplasmic adaptor subunit [Betaproteobacteria bacterium]|nr:efflux RND transporter periplasmic adaptor subunit [Betaproteobacteria bacterium]